MKTTTHKMLNALMSILGGWFGGAVIYFIFSIIGDFSEKSKYIPAVFTGGMIILVALYFIYWAKAKKAPNLKIRKAICCAIGCIVCMLCLVLTYLIFSSSLRNLVPVATIIEGATLLIGQICAYIFGEIKIGG